MEWTITSGPPAIGRAIVPGRLASHARDSRALLRSYALDPATLVVVAVLSLIYQALISMQLVMLARAIDVHIPFATAAVVLALVTVVTLIPISIGGFGIREGTFSLYFSRLGLPIASAVVLSLLATALQMLFSLTGAAVYVTRSK